VTVSYTTFSKTPIINSCIFTGTASFLPRSPGWMKWPLSPPLQIAGSSLCVIGVKAYFVKRLSPQKMLLVYGRDIEREAAGRFCRLLERKYPYIFEFIHVKQEGMPKEEFLSLLDGCDSVMLYEISHGLRGEFMKVCT